jgi:hypothetical protein
MCAAATYAAPGRVGVLAHSPFYQDELGHRFHARHDTALDTKQLPDAAYCAIVWAEPEQNTFAHVLDSIQQLPRTDSLYIITSNPLAQRLPEWRNTQQPPASHPTGIRATMQALRQAQYQVIAAYGFHGPISIAWGVLGQWLARLRRDDLADRCHFAMRLTYVVQGWRACLAPVSVIVARRG